MSCDDEDNEARIFTFSLRVGIALRAPGTCSPKEGGANPRAPWCIAAKTSARLVAATTGNDGITDDAGRRRLRRRVVSIPVAVHVAMPMLDISKYNTIGLLCFENITRYDRLPAVQVDTSSDAACLAPLFELVEKQVSYVAV